MDKMEDPQPFEVESGTPQSPEPVQIQHGKLYTLKEAARLLGRNEKLVQRWHANGWLPSRFETASGHRAVLVTGKDLRAVVDRPRHGVRRPRRKYVHFTANGAKVRIRAKPVRKEA